MSPKRDLFNRPNVEAMSLVDRCRFYAQQIDDYHANPTGGLLEVTQIGKCLEQCVAKFLSMELP